MQHFIKIMKTRNVFFLISIWLCVTVSSCGKGDDNSPAPVPATPADTLSSGWTKQTITDEQFDDIVMLNNNTGYVTGKSLYKTTNGGSSWTKLTTPFTRATNLALTSDNKVFMVNGTNIFYRSSDGGATYSNSTVASAGAANDIFFIDNNTGYSFTTSGLVQSNDGGLNWQNLNPITGVTISPFVYNSCWIFSTSSGLLTNGATIYKSNGSLNSWAKSSFTGATPTGNLMSLYAVSSSVIYAGNNDGKVFASVDGGATFTFKTALTPISPFLDLHFIDANTGYASCGNRIYKTVDGGSSWTTVVALGSSVIAEIHFTDATHGWACTDKGEILKLN